MTTLLTFLTLCGSIAAMVGLSDRLNLGWADRLLTGTTMTWEDRR